MPETQLIHPFIQGAIRPELIIESITKSQSNRAIGAHDMFLGQVRADIIDGRQVIAIDYTAYEEMAIKQFQEIQAEANEKFAIGDLHIFHSLGRVNVGEICLFVYVAAPHRKEVFQALHFVVEEIKDKVPVFGKEIFGDDSYQWKVNT